MTLSRDELHRLERLRALFLDDERGAMSLADYWRDDGDLAAYDSVLAERIGWKWDAVLDECAARGMPRCDDATILDFGCGTGVAARRFAARFGAREVLMHDRSQRAMDFAVRRLAQQGNTAVRGLPRVEGVAPDVLLVSHVLGEIDAREEAALHELIGRSTTLLIVEPGSRDISRRLSALRDSLRDRFTILAPCTHAAACPALRRGDDWCHFFAPPPQKVFTDGDWARRAKALGIDLRALPYSFLWATRAPRSVTDDDRSRLIGRARVETHRARFVTCDAHGLHDVEINKRHEPAAWRALKKHPETLRLWPPETAVEPD